MNAQQFETILAELIDENPFAVRAVLKILAIRYTDEVPTLAVTCRERPQLLVNLAFVAEHCHTEEHVKAVVCHEFLHVLLRHTERLGTLSPLENLAQDAVINAIIHRTLGPDYSDLMAHYYAKAKEPYCLLRPPHAGEAGPDADEPRGLERVWQALYAGELVVDDIREIASDLLDESSGKGPEGGYLGNHGDCEVDDGTEGAQGELTEALDRAMKCMNGDGIWRSPGSCGIGADAYQNVVAARPEALDRWRRATHAVLRKHLTPDNRGEKEWIASGEYTVPVLSCHDRRSFTRSLWSPLMPDALWPQSRQKPRGTAQVYLDVSGSMSAEMPLIVQLLLLLSNRIRRPFWAFSDRVAPARIRRGCLVAETTGGTSMRCVLDHLIETRPPCAVVLTDGYIEPLDREIVKRASATRLHAIVTRDGSPAHLAAAGIAYTQLGRVPQ